MHKDHIKGLLLKHETLVRIQIEHVIGFVECFRYSGFGIKWWRVQDHMRIIEKLYNNANRKSDFSCDNISIRNQIEMCVWQLKKE